MMTYERWREYILDVVGHIASREQQEKIWLGPRPEINRVGDVYNDLAENFLTTFSRDIQTVLQSRS